MRSYELDTEAGQHAEPCLSAEGVRPGARRSSSGFEIGYNPHEDSAVSAICTPKAFSDADMVECGVAGLSGSRMTDRFANRILDPDPRRLWQSGRFYRTTAG